MDSQTLEALAEAALEPRPRHLEAIAYPDARERGEPYYHFLYLLARALKPHVIVELGTYIGTSAKCLAAGAPAATVTTYDVNADAARQVAKSPVYPNLKAKTGNACYVVYKGQPIDLLYIDADHSYNQSLGEWERWLPHVRSGGCIVIDDTDLDDEMRRFVAYVRSQGFDVTDLPGLHHTGFSVTTKP